MGGLEPVSVVEGPVSVLDRADVNTDQIIPQRFCKTTSRKDFGRHLFHDWIHSGEIVLGPAPILVAGENFGCGSSRETAVWAIKDFGFRAVIAPSFADIFNANCTKNGVLPVAVDAEATRAIAEAGAARVDLGTQTVEWRTGRVAFELPPDVRDRLLVGLDDIDSTLARTDEIAAYEREHGRDAPPTTALVLPGPAEAGR